jgi:hypothetical protein
MNGRNVGGALAIKNTDDLDYKSIIPLSKFGQVGDNVIEENYIHHNIWGIYDESEWDLASTIRYNVFDENYNREYSYYVYPTKGGTSGGKNSCRYTDCDGATYDYGGVIFEKDAVLAPHKIYNNTINHCPVVFGNGGWKPGNQHLFYNNLVNWFGTADSTADDNVNDQLRGAVENSSQVLAYYRDFMHNNSFVGGPDSLWLKSKQSGLLTGVYNYGKYIFNDWTASTKYNSTYYINSVDLWSTGGRISKLGSGSVDSTYNNLWAKKMYFYDSTTESSSNYMVPDSTKALMDSLVYHNGWDATGRRMSDGSSPWRGARPVASAVLSLGDQKMVTIDSSTGTRKVSFTYTLTPASTSGWSNLKWSVVNYYKTCPWTIGGPSSLSAYPTALTLSPDASPSFGTNTFSASLTTAPSDTIARFDLIVSGTYNGATVKSNVGSWLWRKTAYNFKVIFLDSATGDTIDYSKGDYVRVGQTVKMILIALKGTAALNGTLDSILAGPDKNMFLNVATTSMTAGTKITSASPLNKSVSDTSLYYVHWTQTGACTINLMGTSGSAVVTGTGTIRVRPGKPYAVEWQTPPSYSTLDHTTPDSALAYVVPQTPTALLVQVVDTFGNTVDTVSTVELTTKLDDSTLLTKGVMTKLGWDSVAASPWTSTLGAKGDFSDSIYTLHVDSTGIDTPYINVRGATGRIFWGYARLYGKTAVDTGLMKVGTTSDHLMITSTVGTSIDTTVNVRIPVTIMVTTDDSTASDSSAYASATIHLSSSSGSLKYYASDTSTTALDSVSLVKGSVTVWVTASDSVISDTIIASATSLTKTKYAPVSYHDQVLPFSGVIWTDDSQGQANKLTITFDQALTAASVDSVAIEFGGVTKMIAITDLNWIGSGSGTTQFVLTFSPFSYGLTRGLAADSYGAKVTIYATSVLDTSTHITSTSVAKDSVPAVFVNLIDATKNPYALLTYGTSGIDTVRVKFSEPVSLVSQSSGLLKSTTAIDIGTTLIKMASTDSLTWIVTQDEGKNLYVLRGDTVLIGPSFIGNDSVVPTTGSYASKAVVLAGDRVPTLAFYSDDSGKGTASHASLTFSEALTRPAILELKWPDSAGTLMSTYDTLQPADQTTYALDLSGIFQMGVTSASTVQLGVMTSETIAADTPYFTGNYPSQDFAINDSVAPMIKSAAIAYGTYEDANSSSDTLWVHFSETIKTLGMNNNMALSFGKNGLTLQGTSGDSLVKPQSLTFTSDMKSAFLLYDTSGSASYVRPSAGDSIRLVDTSIGGILTDTFGSRTTHKAKLTVVTAGKRPALKPVVTIKLVQSSSTSSESKWNYVLQPTSSSSLSASTGSNVAILLKNSTDSSVTVASNANSTTTWDNLTGTIGIEIPMNTGTIGKQSTLSVLVYDKYGTYVAKSEATLDSATVAGIASARTGKFTLYALWDGRAENGQMVVSGVYTMRAILFREDYDSNNVLQRSLMFNVLKKLGVSR